MLAAALAIAYGISLVKDPKKQKGRQERKNSEEGRVRRPNLAKAYRHQLRDINPGDFTFHVALVKPAAPKGQRVLGIDRQVQSIEWTDASAMLEGAINVKRTSLLTPVPIHDRDRIRLFVLWNRKWYRLWEMVVDGEPVPTLEGGEETITLTDDLDALKRNEREWEFKKDKKHPKGWTADQVARYVAAKEGVQIGRLSKGTARIKKLKKKCSGLEIIKMAYAREKKKTLRKFVIRFRDGRLEVLPLKRNRILFEIRGLLRGGTVEARRKNERPITVIEAKGTLDGKKVEAKVFRRGALARFGTSSEEKSYGKVDSKAELKEEAQRDLADELYVTRTAQLEIPGNPFIERGDTTRWATKERGWSGPGKGTLDRQFAYITSISHTVTPGDYTSSVSLSQVDPYLADARRQAKEQREKKDNDRKKKKGDRQK